MVHLFCSYSHLDSRWREELEKHLSMLRRQHILSSWHDRKIEAGQASGWLECSARSMSRKNVVRILKGVANIVKNYF